MPLGEWREEVFHQNPVSLPSPTHPRHMFSPLQPPLFHLCDQTTDILHEIYRVVFLVSFCRCARNEESLCS